MLTEDSRLEIEQQVNGEWQELASSNFDKGLNTLYFRPTSTDVRYRLAGPFYVKVGTECVTKQIMEQQSVLVDVCDEVKDRYRFGFNGQEKVNEWAGIGNHLDFKFRGYDSRTGRLGLSMDPLTTGFPWQSPYVFAGNKPISHIDVEGGREYYYVIREVKENGQTMIHITLHHTVTEITDYLGIKDDEYYILDSKGNEIRGLEFDSYNDMLELALGKTEAQIIKEAESHCQ